MENKKGFTLVEVLISLILAGIIMYFLYVMIMVSYRTYGNLFSVARETNDIRITETYLRKSIMNASFIKIEPSDSATQATSLCFGRQELYWDSGTGTIKNRYVVDMYVVKDSTSPAKTGYFYKDDVYFANQVPDTRDASKEANYQLILKVFYTASNYSITGQPVIREEQLLRNLKVAYFYIPSNTAGGVKRFSLIKIALDFDDNVPSSPYMYWCSLHSAKFPIC